MTNGYVFSERSKRNLRGVHPDLVAVAYLALELTPIDFVVTEGLRDSARQRELVDQGFSTTMNSRHLTGHAIDIAVLLDADGDGRKEVPWDKYTHKVDDNDPWDQAAKAFKQAAEELGVPIVWGGDWTRPADAPHFELERHAYPANGDMTPRARVAKTIRDLAAGAGAAAGVGTPVLMEVVSLVQSPEAQQAQEGLSSGNIVTIGISAVVLIAIALAAWQIMRKDQG